MSDDDSHQPDEDFGADLRAAEYVLGTLAGAAHADFERKLAGDPDLQALVATWSSRLQPLADQLTPVDPPTSLWPRIASAIDPSTIDPSTIDQATIIPLTPRRRRWIIVASAIAASILVAMVVQQFRAPPQPLGVAELASTTQSAALFDIALTDQGARITATPKAVPAIADKSYELWVVPKGKVPISLGLINTDRPTERPINLGLRTELQNGVTLAVSVEPIGGSPSGQPTGPIVFAGTFKLAAVD